MADVKPKRPKKIDKKTRLRARQKLAEKDRGFAVGMGNFKDFTTDSVHINQRIAEFLNYAAIKYPYALLFTNEIARAVYGVGRTVSKDLAKSVQNNMRCGGEKLRKDFNRTLIAEREVGYRASVNDLDKVQNNVPEEVKRLRSASARLQNTKDLVDKKALVIEAKEAGPDAIATARWFNKGVSPYVDLLTDPDAVKALQLPAAVDPAGATETKKK